MRLPKTIQEYFNAIQNGTGSKDIFLKEAKRLYSNLIPNAATFDQTVKIFKNRGVLNENYVDLKPINAYEGRKLESWETKYKSFLKEEEESVKAESTKASKYETDTKKSSYDNSDVKNLDDQIGQEVLNGIAFESRENPDKTLDEIRVIVSKNLAKDKLFYVKNAMFGIKGVGVSDEIPGLKASKTDQMKPVKGVRQPLSEGKDDFTNLPVREKNFISKLRLDGKPITNVSQLKIYFKKNDIDSSRFKSAPYNLGKESRNELKKLLNEAKYDFDNIQESKKKLSKKKKFDKVIGEFDAGTLKMPNGKEVTDRKQALAIAYSESGLDEQNIKLYNLIDGVLKEEYVDGIGIYGRTPDEDVFLRKVKAQAPNQLIKYINIIKNLGLEAAKKYFLNTFKENINESKSTKLEQRLKDIDKAGGLTTLEAKMEAIDEEIQTRQERIDMIGENEDLAELVNPAKLRELQKEVKILEKQKSQLQKIYEKMTGKKKTEVIDEPQEIEQEETEETGEMTENHDSQEELKESTQETEDIVFNNYAELQWDKSSDDYHKQWGNNFDSYKKALAKLKDVNPIWQQFKDKYAVADFQENLQESTYQFRLKKQ